MICEMRSFNTRLKKVHFNFESIQEVSTSTDSSACDIYVCSRHIKEQVRAYPSSSHPSRLHTAYTGSKICSKLGENNFAAGFQIWDIYFLYQPSNFYFPKPRERGIVIEYVHCKTSVCYQCYSSLCRY